MQHCLAKLDHPAVLSRRILFLQERLRDIGQWLGVNGEAIYKSQPWMHQNDTSNPDVWYTRDEMSNSKCCFVTIWFHGFVRIFNEIIR